MKREALSFGLLACALLMPLPAEAKAAVSLKSVNVSLPDSDRDLPDGPGPAMPRAVWEAEVAKMRNVYKAPIPEKDVPNIVNYLTAIKGPK